MTLSQNQVVRQAEQSLAEAERAFVACPFSETTATLKLQTWVVNSLLFEKADRKIFYSKQRMYECEEHAGRPLAYLAHLDHRPPMVVSLRGVRGAVVAEPDAVAEEFRSFFASLYSSVANSPRGEIADMLADIELPTLSKSQVDILEAPISVDEIMQALSTLNPSKVPG